MSDDEQMKKLSNDAHRAIFDLTVSMKKMKGLAIPLDERFRAFVVESPKSSN